MLEIAVNRTPGRFVPGFGDSHVFMASSLGGIDFAPEMFSSRRAATANNNQVSAWPERPFRGCLAPITAASNDNRMVLLECAA